MAEVKDSCFPPSHRESAFTVAALHQWGHTEPPPQDTRCVTTAEDWVNEVVHPNSPGGPLPCVREITIYGRPDSSSCRVRRKRKSRLCMARIGNVCDV